MYFIGFLLFAILAHQTNGARRNRQRAGGVRTRCADTTMRSGAVAVRQGGGVELQIAAPVAVPVGEVVRAGPDVELDRVAVRSQLLDERGVGGSEGILRADVDPDRDPAVGVAGVGGGDHIVAGEVLGIVERAGGAFAAADPQLGRVPAEGPEAPGMKAGDVQRPEATRSEEHTSELQSLTNLVCRL